MQGFFVSRTSGMGASLNRVIRKRRRLVVPSAAIATNQRYFQWLKKYFESDCVKGFWRQGSPLARQKPFCAKALPERCLATALTRLSRGSFQTPFPHQRLQHQLRAHKCLNKLIGRKRRKITPDWGISIALRGKLRKRSQSMTRRPGFNPKMGSIIFCWLSLNLL
jgi:hypothetical protein